MSSYFSVVREMCQAPIMLLWWLQNIEEDKQEEAAENLRIWLKQFPNIVVTHRCGDWYNSRGFIRCAYKIQGLKLTPEKGIELYNFLNKPVMVTEHYAYLTNSTIVRETNCLDVEKYDVDHG